MQQILHRRKSATETRHLIKELVEALPVDTLRAKLALIDKTGIPKHRFYRIYNDPFYKISAQDALALASFFCLPTEELFSNSSKIESIITRIMADCEAIKNLRSHHL